MNWDTFVKQVGTDNLILIAAAVVIVIVVLIVLRQMRLKKRRRMVGELENRLSAVKSLPIQYRLGRVQNIAKSTPEIQNQYNDFERRYDQLVHTQKDEIAILLNEVDEKLYAGKMFGVRKKLATLETKVSAFESDAHQLLKEIEAVTEIENVQRLAIIRVKEKYRKVAEKYESVRYKLEEAVPAIDQYNKEIDQDFIDLENMMNQQRFDEATKQCEKINEKVDFLATNVRDLPTYLSLSTSYIPGEIEKIQNRIVDLRSRGFSLARLDVENRVRAMQEKLNQSRADIQALEISRVGENLNAITAEITKLNDEFEVEEAAQSEFNQIYKDVFDKTNELKGNFELAKSELEKLKTLYVIDEDEFDLDAQEEKLIHIQESMDELKKDMNANEFSYQELVSKLKALSQESDGFAALLTDFFARRDEMDMTEKRALHELESINTVLLEIKSQIKNKQLPVINESYKDYISDSYKKANEIQFLCKSRPIILDNLTKQVDIARDIIYKLYENIHNLIVTADMVEEAIVFGNRYRSSFLEVNTELTKAEVLYRNGEYTKALSTAVDIIEKIKPGSYERLLKKKGDGQDPQDLVPAKA